MKRTLLGLLALALLLFLCACGGPSPEPSPAPEETTAPEPSPTGAPVQPASAQKAAPTPIPDLEDRPANRAAAPENSWIEVDYTRDGVPFDPEAPTRDGHRHDWVIDAANSYESTCLEKGKYVHICSLCGGQYVTWEEPGPHRWTYEITAESHRTVCSVCGQVSGDWAGHEWHTDNERGIGWYICFKCGYEAKLD